jgi:hypothetical protein
MSRAGQREQVGRWVRGHGALQRLPMDYLLHNFYLATSGVFHSQTSQLAERH